MKTEQWLPDEEVRNCDACGNPHNGVLLYIVDVNIGVVNLAAVRERTGLTMMFGGNSALARVMGAYSEGVVKINDDPALKHRILLCVSCHANILGEVIERMSAKKEATA